MQIADHILNAGPVHKGSNMYKATRTDGAVSAVEIFPLSLSPQQTKVFEEQVALLKELQLDYKAAVPAVLSWGFTKTGLLPYIEMEWIDGPSLTEIQKEKKLLTIEEVSNVAEEVSRIMAHCYKLHLKHGNISSDTVLWDVNRRRYVLTGFLFGLQPTTPITTNGISVLPPASDNETEVKRIGALLLQLLTGKAYLNANEDISIERQQLLPEAPAGQTTVPEWLSTCINKALGIEQTPFENAIELHSFILYHHKRPLESNRFLRSKPQPYFGDRQKPPLKAVGLSPKNIKFIRPLGIKKKKEEELRFVFDRNIAAGLIIAVLLVGFSVYAQNKENRREKENREAHLYNKSLQADSSSYSAQDADTAIVQPSPVKKPKAKKTANPAPKKKAPALADTTGIQPPSTTEASADLGSYKVRSKAYFHNAPDESTRRNAFIVHWNNAVLHPLKEENGFVYVIYTNEEGQTSKGWLKKSDLIKQ